MKIFSSERQELKYDKVLVLSTSDTTNYYNTAYSIAANGADCPCVPSMSMATAIHSSLSQLEKRELSEKELISFSSNRRLCSVLNVSNELENSHLSLSLSLSLSFISIF